MKIKGFKLKFPEHFPNEKFSIVLSYSNDQHLIRIRAERKTNEENLRIIQTLIPKTDLDSMKNNTSMIDVICENCVSGVCSCLAVPNSLPCKEKFTEIIIKTLREFLL